MLVPAALRPGDTVAIVAPSSPLGDPPPWDALGFLAARYRLRFDQGLFARTGFLAGDDARRRHELADALSAPDVAAIVAGRGGYGAARIVADLPWDLFRRNPKWIVGFSDTTALHVEALRVGVAALHAGHLTSLGKKNLRAREAWVSALEDPLAERRHERLEVVSPGEAEGMLVGGNLTTLHAAAVAGRLTFPPHTILFLEDVGERPYRIDRMLTSLRTAGSFRDLGGIVLGSFSDCDPGPDGVTSDEVLREHFAALGIPVIAGFPAGHGNVNTPLVLGATALLHAGETGEISIRAGRCR